MSEPAQAVAGGEDLATRANAANAADTADTADMHSIEELEKYEGFDYPSGELVRYINPSLEGVEQQWIDLDERELDLYWRRGAIADAISNHRVYGQRDLERFANRMGVAKSTMADYLATYRRVDELAAERRLRVLDLNLSYSHYRAANGVDDDVYYENLLTRAADGLWNVGRTADAAALWRTLERNAGGPALPGTSRTDTGEGEHIIRETSLAPEVVPEPPEGEPAEEGERPGAPVSVGVSTEISDAERWSSGDRRDLALIEEFLHFCNSESVELAAWDSERRELTPLGWTSARRRELIESYLGAR